TAKELTALWEDLGGADAARAYRAVRVLAAGAGQAVPFLRQRLRPTPDEQLQRIARLVKELDSERFAVRRQAGDALRQLGRAAEPALRHALEKNPSLEMRKRVEELLEKLDGPALASEALRDWRALQVLEATGTAARQVFEALARGRPEDWLTREAQA